MRKSRIIPALTALTALTVLAGCSDSMETQQSPNGKKAEMIAIVDGCKVWRIYDGNYVYFARCPEGTADTSYETGGKNNVRVEAMGVRK